jgi:FkbM family methyltransferase
MIEYEGHKVFNPHYLFYIESDKRDAWQKPDEVLSALEIPPAAVVADIGAGGGYFTERFSRHLGSTGHVYATDVQELMIQKLKERVERRGLKNVEVIHAAFDEPMLPESSCDLVFFSSVYKEIDDRVNYMKRIAETLRPGGRVAIIEYHPHALALGPPLNFRLRRQQVVEELSEAGFVLIEEHDFLRREYFLVFSLASISTVQNSANTRV